MKRKKSNHLFSKVIVVFCIAFCVFVSLFGLYMTYYKQMEISSLVGVILATFGGELLFMCIKSTFGRNDDNGTGN